jgi:hypothetical protein
MDRRTPRVEGRRSGARAIDKNTSLRYEWPELMISQRDGYHHEAHSYMYVVGSSNVLKPITALRSACPNHNLFPLFFVLPTDPT